MNFRKIVMFLFVVFYNIISTPYLVVMDIYYGVKAICEKVPFEKVWRTIIEHHRELYKMQIEFIVNA